MRTGGDNPDTDRCKGKLTGRLTPREREVSRMLMHSNKEIAHRLGLTHYTIIGMIKTIMRKLGCRNRTEVALLVEREESDGGS